MIGVDMGFTTRLAILHALLLAALTSAAYAEWEEYQYETFDSTETIFPTGQIGEATGSVDSQGRYVINGMETGKDSLSAIRDNVSFYRVSSDCQILSSTAGELAFCGLLFHYGKRSGSDLPSYYVFYAYGDGFYGVKRIVDGGKSDVIIPLEATDLLAGGEPNSLAVEARGNRFDLFINGQRVNSFTDMQLDGGGYGVYISKFSIAAFDNFEVLVEPAPVRAEAEQTRNQPKRGIKPLDIPRNPDRPLYPWEVGYDKDPKKKKRKLQSERQGDGPSKTRSTDAPKPQASRPRPAKKQADNSMQRNTTSRRGDAGFVADEEPKPAAKRTGKGTALRQEYKESRGDEPEPEPVSEPEPKPEPVIEDPLPEAKQPEPVRTEIPLQEAEPAAEPEPVEVDVEPQPLELEAPMAPAEPEPIAAQAEPTIELVDEPVTDIGKALPESEGSEEDLLYRRAPEFAETEAETEKPAKATPDKSAGNTEEQPRKRGIRISGDDWDQSATAYVPKPREQKPQAEKPAKKPTEQPKKPAKAIASDGSPMEVETLPLDGAPLRDPELKSEPEEEEAQEQRESKQPVETSKPERAELALPEPEQLEVEVEREVAAEPTLELELPVVPDEPIAEPEQSPAEPEASAPANLGDSITVSDDFTSQQVWQTQDLPTSSYKYLDGGYSIDNQKAQTMAISYQQETLRDIAISVDAAHSGGADYVGFGVAGRFILEYDNGRPLISYYGLFISRSGEFMLLKVVDGAETVLRDWAISPAINLGGVNNVELRISGTQITAVINGQEVASLTDGEIASGGYALLAGPGIAALFDNLKLTGVRQ